MNRSVAVFIAGLAFALGLGISGMTDANKVLGFLNLSEDWDPSLAFVMIGAIGVHFGLYRWIVKRRSPLLAKSFQIPNQRNIDEPLVTGSVLFGAGWGLAGICPGPAIVSAAAFQFEALLFVFFMLVGMVTSKTVRRLELSVGLQSERVS